MQKIPQILYIMFLCEKIYTHNSVKPAAAGLRLV